MNDCDPRRYDRASRARIFGEESAADLAAGSKAKTHFANQDHVIGKLDAAKAGRKPFRASKEALLDGLMIDFKNTARTARSIELTENGFAATYRTLDNPSESTIITHADAQLVLLEDQPADSAAVKTAKAASRVRVVAYELPAGAPSTKPWPVPTGSTYARRREARKTADSLATCWDR